MLKRFNIRFEVIIILLVIAVNGFVAFAPENSLMNWYTTDDAFYYFKTAQNITEGHGVTFDGIGRSSGFHPLWMAICIPVFALARIDLMLPLRVLAGISILFAAGSGALLFRMLKRVIAVEAAALIALFWVLNPDIHYVTTQLGMEASVNAFFSILLLSMVSRFELSAPPDGNRRRELLQLGLVALLTLMSRLDNVFLVLLVGVWVVLRQTNIRYLLLSDWILTATAVFCSFFLRLGFREAYEQYIPSATIMLFISLLTNTVVFYMFGLYGYERKNKLLHPVLQTAVAVSATAVITGSIMLALQKLGVFTGFPRGSILLDWGLSLVFVFGTRFIFQKVLGNPHFLPPALPENRVLNNLKRWFSDSIPYFAPLGIGLAVYMAWNYFYFGTPMPVSGQIKHWWGTMFTVYGRPVDSLWRFFGLTDNLNGGTWGLLFYFQNNAAELTAKLAHIRKADLIQNMAYGFGLFFLCLSAWFVAKNFRHILGVINRLAIFPLLVANFSQIFYYNGTNYVNMRPWYWVTQILLVAFLFALVVEAVFQNLRRVKTNEKLIKAGTLVLSLIMIAGLVSMLGNLVPLKVIPKKAKSYLGGMLALEKVTEPGALIGSTGGGVIGYFIKDRTIVNLDGLMNSYEYFSLLKAQKGEEYLDRIGVTYIYGNKYMITESEPFFRIFKDRLEEVGNVGGSMLFRYKALQDTNKGG